MKDNRVVITGIGMLTPLGANTEDTVAAWRAGQQANRESLEELSGTVLEEIEVGILPQFKPAERLGSRRMLKYMSEAAVLGCVAAHEAASDADIGNRFRSEHIGLYAGTGIAAASVKDALPMIRASVDEDGALSYRLLGEKGLAATNPLLSFKILANMPPCIVSIVDVIKGPNLIFTPWEGQTGAALREAWMAVGTGEVDCALTGAADYASHPATVVYLKRMNLLQESEYPSAGAAYLVMERAETALKDNRRIYAEISDVAVGLSDRNTGDPLVQRMGRTFAAAPAILLALAAMDPNLECNISGVDQHTFQVELKVIS